MNKKTDTNNTYFITGKPGGQFYRLYKRDQSPTEIENERRIERRIKIGLVMI